MITNNSTDLLHTDICTFIVYRPYHPSISWKYYIMSTVPGSLRRNMAVNMSMLLKHISHFPCNNKKHHILTLFNLYKQSLGNVWVFDTLRTERILKNLGC